MSVKLAYSPKAGESREKKVVREETGKIIAKKREVLASS